jgi:hypothetical protein
MCRALAIEDVEERQAAMAVLAAERQTILELPGDEPLDTEASVLLDVDKEATTTLAIKLQSGFRGQMVCSSRFSSCARTFSSYHRFAVSLVYVVDVYVMILC